MLLICQISAFWHRISSSGNPEFEVENENEESKKGSSGQSPSSFSLIEEEDSNFLAADSNSESSTNGTSNL